MATDPRYPPLGSFLVVDGTRLHYVDSSPGREDLPAVVMVHGNPGTVHSFVPGVFASLGDSFRCIAVDRPGHGYSDRLPHEGGSPSAQTRVIRDAVHQLGVSRPLLGGT